MFAEARARGGREPAEAYAADALFRVFDRAARCEQRSGRAAAGSAVDLVDDWSFSKVIVRVDATALDRGALAEGEVCEIAGRGPIPVGDAWRMIDGDAFVAAIATDGTDITKLVHLGRKPTALQRTALEWLSAGECSTEGCSSPARIEIDHVADWADTLVTTLPHLASPCGYHHDLKTHHGYRFGPLLSSGKRRLIPPDSTDPPDSESGADGRSGGRATGGAEVVDRIRFDAAQVEQHELFDTG